MKKTTKKILIRLLIVCTIIIAAISWFFPFSQLSIYKSFSYNPDPVVVEQYKDDLNRFKNTYNKNSRNQKDLTNERIQYIIEMYEDDSFLSDEGSKITKHSLASLLLELKETRKILIELAFEESYEKNTEDYLRLLLENTIVLEENIKDIINSNGNSRFTLERQYSNLNMGLNRNLKFLESFYNEYAKNT
ncbi:hypothetical protein ACTWQL_03815 [Pseudalkalibacillus sp. R45]|uniref:hypothetical protein n=1 Tax=Pseudalkalibacillus sp. R45 TaxID=3457433 RepID=UPI003FCD74B5